MRRVITLVYYGLEEERRLSILRRYSTLLPDRSHCQWQELYHSQSHGNREFITFMGFDVELCR